MSDEERKLLVAVAEAVREYRKRRREEWPETQITVARGRMLDALDNLHAHPAEVGALRAEVMRANYECVDAMAQVATLRARVARLEEALTNAADWHAAQGKALSKQPPGGDRDWRRLQHREEEQAARTALEQTP